jgi:cytoskeleton protein RodZ
MTDAPSPAPPRAGRRLLRAAREKQGLHIAALAAAIKVSPRKLDALENDRWHELPDATFVRALAQTVCRTLKIDPARCWPCCPSPPVAAGTGEQRLNTPFRDRPGRDPAAWRPAASGPWWPGLLLLLAAVAWCTWCPASLWSPPCRCPGVAAPRRLMPPSGAGGQCRHLAQPAPIPCPMVAAIGPTGWPPSLGAVQPDRQRPMCRRPRPLRQLLAALHLPSVRAGDGALRHTPRRPASPPAARHAAGLLQLRCRRPGWTCVTPAWQTCCCPAWCPPGEAVGLDARVAGAAENRQRRRARSCSFRGQPVDLTGRARDNVARLELHDAAVHTRRPCAPDRGPP